MSHWCRRTVIVCVQCLALFSKYRNCPWNIPYSGYGTQDKIICQLGGYDIYFRVSFAAVWHRYQWHSTHWPHKHGHSPWNYVSMWCVTRYLVYTMLPLKWPSTTRHFPFSGRHLGFPVDDILSLNIAFRSRTIFRKSHKHTPLYISRFQKYAGESDLGGNFTPPPRWTSKG